MSDPSNPAQDEMAALFAAVDIPVADGACITPGATFVDLFFPTKTKGADNHGTVAKSICAGCPIREACLAGALARNEEHGIWGGAGEQRRRTLRRAQAEGHLDVVWAAHWRALGGEPRAGDSDLLAGFGPNATHGNPATYAKGCSCDACALAVSVRRTAPDKFKTRPRKTKEST